jgi:hypothetical protein
MMKINEKGPKSHSVETENACLHFSRHWPNNLAQCDIEHRFYHSSTWPPIKTDQITQIMPSILKMTISVYTVDNNESTL